jgi:hypothetical protein
MYLFKMALAPRLAYVLLVLSAASNFALGADGPPVITSQPQPQTALEGVNLTVRVAAVSSTPIRYRWRFYGTNLPNDFPGQFTPLLSLRNVTPAVSGPYSVVLSNNFGAVTSAIAQVTVSDPAYAGGGYIRLESPPGYSLLTAQMSSSGSSQTVSNQLQFLPDGVSVFKMDGNGFTANNRLDGWSLPDQVLAFGEGWFVYNPTAEPLFILFTGTILGGHMVDKLPTGYSVSASMVPQTGPLTLLSFPSTPGAMVYRFDNLSESYSLSMAGEDEWAPSEPSVSIGEAFWIKEPYAVEWARDFSINFAFTSPSYTIVQPALTSEVGEINFFTYHTNSLLGRVLDLDGETPLNSPYMGQLWAGTNDSEAALAPIGSPLPFLDGFGAGYIRGGSLKLPGLRGGDTVYLQLRVWERCAGDTYDRAVVNGSATGRSSIFSAIAHAIIENGGPGLPPRNANTFPTFAVSLGEAVLQIARVQPSTNGQTEICFATQPGSVYCLQRAVSLQAPAVWEPVLGANEITGTGHMAKIVDVTAAQAFYRVCQVR